ncbi:MAG TPA: hypothetical protein VHM31_06300 [Polyangia bacterium]|nr:hypothetical protein [Polyangia bacterium]
MTNDDVMQARAALMELFGLRSPLGQIMNGIVAVAGAMTKEIQRWAKAHPAEVESLLKLARETQTPPTAVVPPAEELTKRAQYNIALLQQCSVPQLGDFKPQGTRPSTDNHDDEPGEPTPDAKGRLLN